MPLGYIGLSITNFLIQEWKQVLSENPTTKFIMGAVISFHLFLGEKNNNKKTTKRKTNNFLHISLTHVKMYPFKVHDLMVFSIFTELPNHHHNPVENFPSPPK